MFSSHEDSRHWQRRPRARPGLEIETVFRGRSHFLCAQQRRNASDLRECSHSRNQSAAAARFREKEQGRSRRGRPGRSAGDGDCRSFHGEPVANFWTEQSCRTARAVQDFRERVNAVAKCPDGASANTGGMGAFSPANNWNAELQARFEKEVMRPVLRGLAKEKITYRGLLYPGLMITEDGPRVLEFNCRFGDPEAQVLLPRMTSDLLPLLEATIDGKIDKCAIEWDKRASVTIVLASAGYPGKYETGETISGLEEASKLDGVQIFHAGTKLA